MIVLKVQITHQIKIKNDIHHPKLKECFKQTNSDSSQGKVNFVTFFRTKDALVLDEHISKRILEEQRYVNAISIK